MNKNPIIDEFLSTSLNLFKQFGYKKVSVEDICKKTGISKMTFYKYFKNKLDLMKQIIDMLTEDSITKFNDILKSNDSFDKKVEMMIKMKLETSSSYGPVLIQDILENVKELHDYIFTIKTVVLNVSIDMYKAGIQDGYIRKNISEDYFLFLMNYVIQMLDDPKFINFFPDVNDRIRENVNFFFYGIFNFNNGD